ncbi:ABC transporter ATP-binding protein [Nocardia sp. NPDC057227]|uniref:ABC transporter ATP-binding protein n=1 Tax=Nocardia sp. NPDC057227 TaxID=3346056 RepID=UPI003630EB2E
MTAVRIAETSVATTVPALRVRGLTVRYAGREPAVRDVDLEVGPGEIVALLGQSGSGKSSILNAVLGLLPDDAAAETAELAFGGQPVDPADRRRMRAIRGRRVGLVPQDCTVALDPVLRVGPQLLEGVPGARRLTREQRRARIAELLGRVGFDDPDAVARRYPHELSGGMAQRVLIAVALAAGPALLIADEPAAALDTIAQARVMDWIAVLAERERIGVLMVTHDLALAAERATRGVLLGGGTVRTEGDIGTVIRAARAGLGAPPSPAPAAPSAATRPREVVPGSGGEPAELLALDGVRKLYGGAGVHEASLTLAPGDALALVGGSGAGKTTLARLLTGLESPDAGAVRFAGRDLRTLDRAARREFRRAVQLVAQQPFSAIDPRYSAHRAIEEPLRAFAIGDRKARVRELAARVGLPEEVLSHTPDRLSGGQCQRVAIARAIATGPRVLICDEAVSALDDAATAQILALLRTLRADLGLAVVFVTHDLNAAAAVTDRLVVLAAGRVVETGATAEVFGNPRHPYTRDLVAATPRPVPDPEENP